MLFADVITPMIEAMTKAKDKYGKDYHLAGGDGVHPAATATWSWPMPFSRPWAATATWATINVDLAGGKAEASRRPQGGVVRQAERSRSKAPAIRSASRATRPSPRDPRRDRVLSLQCRSEPADAQSGRRARQGGQSHLGLRNRSSSPSEQLAQGINLAAEFLDNPFVEPFHKVESQIRKQQDFETPLVKKLIHNLAGLQAAGPRRSGRKIVESAFARQGDWPRIAAGASRRSPQSCRSHKTRDRAGSDRPAVNLGLAGRGGLTRILARVPFRVLKPRALVRPMYHSACRFPNWPIIR